MTAKPRTFKEYLATLDWKIALRSGIAATCGLWVGFYLSHFFQRPDSLVSGLWCALTSVIVIQALLGSTYRAAWNRFLGVLFGSFLGALFTYSLGSDPFSLGIAVFVTVIICSVFRLEESYRIAAVSTIIVMVLWGLRPETSPWVFSWFRFLDSTLGLLIGMAIAYTVLPSPGAVKLRDDIISVLQLMERFLEKLLVSDTKPEDEENFKDEILFTIYGYLHQNRRTYEESKPELLLKTESLDFFTSMIDYLENLYESLNAFAAVNRVSVRSIFDESLNQRLVHINEEQKKSIGEIVRLLKNSEEEAEIVSTLPEALEGLKEELLHFREKHLTRKYHLDDVEGFFVYFYSLKAILETLIKIENKFQ